jgi:hypothetical protein
MPTTQAEREAARALIRTNLRRFVDEIGETRSDRVKTNLCQSIASLQIAALLNTAETVEATIKKPS